MDHFELFKNLLVMAAADGKLTDEEVSYLTMRSVRWRIDTGQFQQALKQALDPDAVITLPHDKQQCLELLGDLVRMMAVDGELADVEKELFAVAAAHMNVSGEELDQLIDAVLAGEG